MPDARFVCRTNGANDARNLNVAEFSVLPTVDLLPVTTIPAWVGRQAYEGRWWFSQTASHVAFASSWERDVLALLDYRGEVAAIARDPAIVFSPCDRTALPQSDPGFYSKPQLVPA